MDYEVLRDELVNDPLGLGYTVDQPVNWDNGPASEADAALLNSLSTGRTRNRAVMTGREFKDEWDTTEFSALTDAQKDLLYSMASRDDLDPFGIDATVVQDIFPPAGATITALAAARVETISRATELGLGRVLPGDVQNARKLGYKTSTGNVTIAKPIATGNATVTPI